MTGPFEQEPDRLCQGNCTCFSGPAAVSGNETAWEVLDQKFFGSEGAYALKP